MSISDIKHTLRSMEFPQSAREALVRIEQLLVGRTAPSSKQLDNVMDIIAEFVFCESDRRGSRRGSGLNSLQELQLVDIICDYLTSCTNDTTKNTVFLSLFGGMESPQRLKILSILASMAVSAASTPVLLAVGVWLQQMGSASSQSLQLVENIIKDHFFLNRSNQTMLKSLASSVPQFVSNFITAVTELYLHDVRLIKMPPKSLLEVITSWVYSTPSLCMSAQLNPLPLPPGAIPMAAVTPLAGLLRWCALAPLGVAADAEMEEITVPIKKIKLEGVKDSSSHRDLSESQLYIKLQLGVLHALRAGRRVGGPPTAVNAQQLGTIVHLVHKYTHKQVQIGCNLKTDVKLQHWCVLAVRTRASSEVPGALAFILDIIDTYHQDCLDRIGQSVQVALANGCVYGNINSLLTGLNTLPENRLLKIVIRTHQQTI